MKREFSLWSAFAFAFAFISPIVAMYGIYGLSLSTAGPGFWWTFLIVGVGQFFVALAFAEFVSRWPLEGSIYQWTKKLAGDIAGWFAGWVYMWALVIIMATVAYGGAGFLAHLVGVPAPTAAQQSAIALGILIAGTIVNILGRTFLKVLMVGSIIAEIVASVGLSTYLLIFHRHQGFDAVLHGPDLATGWSWAYMSGPFLAALAFTSWSILGFESAGAIAEEVKDPQRNVPRAMIFAVGFIALVIAYASLAVALAVPDFDIIASGEVADPVYYVLESALGSAAVKPILFLFVIGFLASFLALQATGSRVIWSYARDRALPGSKVLVRLSRAEAQPVPAILVTTVIGALVYLISSTDVYSVLVTFTAGGYYLAFLFPLVTGLISRLRGTWEPGAWNLGRLSTAVASIAVLWAGFAFINIIWPRQPTEPWYINWAFFVAMGAILALGAAIQRTRLSIPPDGPSADPPRTEPEQIKEPA
ncbi:APC family permease [Mycolicibacterium sp. A43C]